jgi:hypothetical protein
LKSELGRKKSGIYVGGLLKTELGRKKAGIYMWEESGRG